MKSKNITRLLVVLAGIVLVASTLRAPITSVGPVITEITDQLVLSHVLVGLVTAIPLISFAVLSVFVPKAARKIGLERLLLYSMLVLALGSYARSYGNVPLLFLGAGMIGAAITIGNVLMPAFIKKKFPEKVGLITGIYLVSMNLTSALAAGFSINIGQATGMGWKTSIGVWGFLALIAFFVWLPQVGEKVQHVQPGTAYGTKKGSAWRSSLAWNVSVFMGLQSFLFYSFAAWLPTVLLSWGMSYERSGWMLSYIQMAQLPIMLIGPILAGKMKDQSPLVWFTFVLLLLGIGGVIFGKTDYIIISVILLGISLGLAFTLATMFFVLRTKNILEAADLSGMAQSVGYWLAACGPPAFGALYEITGTWYASLGMLVVAIVLLFITGLASAKDRYVHD